ncbi:hypothetical protein N6H14_08720 [Paenibacillus sp. CC-CFT747]|nr:hypothetical protein N6H14_08720 [Paenibacillus sp. CC-CFT747]
MALIDELSKVFNDYDIYHRIAAYKYKNQPLPFPVAAEVVKLALTQKYKEAVL